jgi:hypothetical protein
VIGAQVRFERDYERLLTAIDRAKAGSLSSSAFIVRDTAIKSVKHSKRIRGYFYSFPKGDRSGKPKLKVYYEPAPAGQPILAHRRGVGFFRAGLKYDVDKAKDEAVVGWLHSRFNTIMATHEHGETWQGTQYDKRPTMAPALAANVEKFHRDWQSSIN